MTIEEQLEKHEGRRSHLYQDSLGKWTIGIGRNLSDGCLSDDEIDLMLQNDIKKAVSELDKNLPWWEQLDYVRQRVMIDLMFNMGAPTLLTFKNTLHYIETGQYDLAATNLLKSKYASQVGRRADTLAIMLRTGQDA